MHLLRFFSGVFVISLKRELAYRANLLFQLLTTAAGVGAELATLQIIFSQTERLAGWSLNDALILLGTYQGLSGILSTFIEPNLLWFNNQVKEGLLDDILLKPIPSIFLASLGSCAPLGMAQILLGLVFLFAGVSRLSTPPSAANLAGWLVLAACGISITWATRVLLASLAFWAPHLDLDVLYGAFWQFGRYPITIYRQPVRALLTYILPVALIATLPAQALIHGATPGELLSGLAAAAAVLSLVTWAWNAGLRRYSSATS